MVEKKLVPKRRFREFDEGWETYKLGNQVNFFSGLTYSPKNVVSTNGTFVIRSSNIKNNKVVDADNVYVKSSIVNSEQVKTGDIIVVVRNGSRNLIGKHAVVRDAKPNTVIGAFMTGIRSEYYNFNNALLNTKLFKRQIFENLGATINQITTGVFGKMIFNFPNVKEQQKIGEFFKVLDERIANQEQKITKVKALKSAYLTEMFPQEGETVPKKRFQYFTEDWFQDRLENLLELLKDGTHGTHKNADKGVYLLSAKNIKKGEIRIDEEDRKISIEEYKKIHKYFHLKKGDVLLTIVGSIGESAILDNPNGYTFQRSVAYLRPKKEINSEFLYAKINSYEFQKKLKNRQVLSAQAGIYLRDLSDIFITFPNLKEQEKIGQFFKNLDDQIEMEEKKLDKLQKMKEAYLEEMFV